MPEPGFIKLIDGDSDPLVKSACFAGFSLVDIMSLGLSPIAVNVNEAWIPLIRRASENFGYCWEWVPDEADAQFRTEAYQSENPWWSCPGRAVLRKV